MPTIAIMRHGVALRPPEEVLAFDSCRRNLALLEATRDIIGPTPIIATALDHETSATARVANDMFRTEVFAFTGLAEKGTADDMDEFVEWLLKRTSPIIVITHRRRVNHLFAALTKQTGKKLSKTPGFRYKLFERYPRMILVNTDTLETRIIQARKLTRTGGKP